MNRRTYNFNPDWRSPPGDTIKELLRLKKWTISEFAIKMEQSEEWIEKLLIGEIAIDASIARKLEDTCGGTSRFWVAREKDFRKPKS